MAPRSKAYVCGPSLAGIAVSNPAGGMDVCYQCCVLSARGLWSGSSLVQRCPTECGVSECDREASTVSRPWPTRGYRAMARGGVDLILFVVLISRIFSRNIVHILSIFSKTRTKQKVFMISVFIKLYSLHFK